MPGRDFVRAKRDIRATLVAIMEGCTTSRGLRIIEPSSRAIQTTEIHELMLTDDLDAGPGGVVDRVSFIGFIEVTLGGIVKVGDQASTNKRTIGVVVGFDLTHYPNHMNILLRGSELTDGMALGLAIGDEIVFDMPG